VYVKDSRGFWSNSFISARGSDPEAGQGGGSGVDMESVWYALAQPTTEKINVSHIPALQQLSGSLTNAQLANSAITVAGVSVSLGGSVSTEQIASALTAAGYKLTDTIYTLPKATVSALGGIKAAGVRTSAITTTQGGTTSGKYYGVELDSNGKAFVNVPWVNTTYSLSSFGVTATAAEINKLDGLATTAAELGYVHGVTSNIQTQLNAKANASALAAYLPLAGGTLTGQLNGRGAHFNSKNGGTPFVISRDGDTKESVSISVNNTVTRFDVTNDETSANLLFSLSATDTVAGGGAAAKTGYVNDILGTDTIYTRYGYGASQRFRIGWNPNDGAYIENFTARKWISITDTGSLLYNSDKIWHSGNDGSGSGLDADLLDGKHYSDIINGNVASATKLATARSIWGQTFDGSGNVSGDMTGVGWINNALILSQKGVSADNSDTTTFRINGHNLEFGGRGYAHQNYYFRPQYSASGETYADMYIQNASAADSPVFSTTHYFDHNGNAYHWGHVGIGMAPTGNRLDVNGTIHSTTGVYSDGYVFAQNGVTIGSTDDIGWYLNSSRITAGTQVARGVNVGNLLVSNVWVDYTKVPANGIYSKGAVLTDGYLQVGSGRLKWDAANNALYVEKSDGTACGLYSKGYMSARGSDPEAATGGSSELVPVVTLSKLTEGTNVSISVLANAGLTNDVLEKMRDGAVGRIKAVYSDGSTEILPVLHASEDFISFGYDTVAGGYQDTMDIYEITIPPKTTVIRVEHFER